MRTAMGLMIILGLTSSASAKDPLPAKNPPLTWYQQRQLSDGTPTIHPSGKVTPLVAPYEFARDESHPFRFLLREQRSKRVVAEISRPLGGGPVTLHALGKHIQVLTTTVGVDTFLKLKPATPPTSRIAAPSGRPRSLRKR